MTKEQKAEIVKDISNRLGNATGLYLTNFAGMTVEQANNLRKEFYKLGIEYVVVKNTLLKLALAQVGGYEGLYPYLVQQTGLAISYQDPIQPARVIEKFMKTNADKPAVKACSVEKQVFDGSKLSQVAALPTRNDLIAGIIGTVAAPAQGIVGAINAVIRDLVTVVDAIEKKMASAA